MKPRILLKKNMRQYMTILSVFVLYLFAGVGIFSYFQSKDTVTNRLSAHTGAVSISEPLWDSQGQYMAQKSEPGMRIPKNPYGYNNSQSDLYIRMKMTVELEEYSGDRLTGFDTADGETGIPTDEKRFKAIIGAIGYTDKTTGKSEKFLTLNTNTASISDWKITSESTSGGNFIPDQVNYGGNNRLVFYFYYTAGDENNNMKVVGAGESTAELFEYLDIPIYKRDYLGIFDQGYTITLEAQAIPVSEDKNLTAEEAMQKFEE